RATRTQRLAHRHEQVAFAGRDAAHLDERRRGGLGVPPRSHPRRPLELPLLPRRVEPMQLDVLFLALVEAVDADDHALARLDLLLVAERGLLDLALDEALLDRRDRAAALVDLRNQLTRPGLELVGERLDEVGAAERIG